MVNPVVNAYSEGGIILIINTNDCQFQLKTPTTRPSLHLVFGLPGEGGGREGSEGGGGGRRGSRTCLFNTRLEVYLASYVHTVLLSLRLTV